MAVRDYYFAEIATRNPMKGRRAPGSAAPLVVVRTSCGPSAKPPPRITHNASLSRPVRSSDRIVRIRLIRTSRPLPHVARHVRQAKRAFRTREAARGHRGGAAEVGAIAPRLVAPGKAPAIGAARGFLPLRFGRQRHVPAVAQRLRRSRRRARRRLERRFEPAAIGNRIRPRHKRDRMVRRARQRARIDGPLPRLRESRELGDGHFMAGDEERRQIDRALACRRRPLLVVERQRIAGAIGAHGERARGDFDEFGDWGLGPGTWACDSATMPTTTLKPSLSKRSFINSTPSRTQTTSRDGTRAA